MGGGGKKSKPQEVKVAKTTPATTPENENIKVAGDNTRRRISAMNSRTKASDLHWTALMSPKSATIQKKSTLG